VIYFADKSPFGHDGELRENLPVRIHDQCLTSEVFRSQRYVPNSLVSIGCCTCRVAFIVVNVVVGCKCYSTVQYSTLLLCATPLTHTPTLLLLLSADAIARNN
jgi:hypothetical protein